MPAVSNTDSDTASLAISVVNIQGKPVPGLAKEDLQVFLDGHEAEITSLIQTSEPVNFIFLIDASPSAELGNDEVAKRAMFVLGQLSPGDRAMVIKFDTNLKVMCKLTDDLQAAGKAIKKVKMGNGTALYDHIRHISEQVIPTMTGRTAVILFTDGVDTMSRRAKYDTSLAVAERLDAVFYTVYFDTLSTALSTTGGALGARQLQAMGITPLPGMKTDPKQIRWEYQMGIHYINDLATMSGGRATPAESLAGPTAPPFTSIPSEIRNRYVVNFVRQGQKAAGQRQELKVRVNRPNLVVLARGSYIVR